jgi:sensor histidine kinase YesM
MKQQYWHNLVFSNERTWRWKRHFLFWLVVFFYHLLRIGIMMPAVNTLDSMLLLFRYTMMNAMITNPFLTYSIVYFLIPKYFNRKKYFFFIGGMVLVILLILFHYFIINWFNLNSAVRHAIGLSDGLLITTFKPGFIRAFGNPPLITGLFLSLKTLKNWQLEQLRTETLSKENTNAELQLLKAQVHPHFLFNTLNNIYSFTLSKSPEASSLISKLSDTLQYMISDCKTDLVPLEKELKMLEDYTGLEKVRYGDRLEMWTDVRGDYKDKLIAPLIMIPFVENCFKHGSSAMRGKQWIQLSIHIRENMLHFQLKNSKPPEPVQIKNKNGIGLINVKKRLALLYPNHQLDISSAEGVFSVSLQLELQTANRDKKELINKYAVATI